MDWGCELPSLGNVEGIGSPQHTARHKRNQFSYRGRSPSFASTLSPNVTDLQRTSDYQLILSSIIFLPRSLRYPGHDAEAMLRRLQLLRKQNTMTRDQRCRSGESRRRDASTVISRRQGQRRAYATFTNFCRLRRLAGRGSPGKSEGHDATETSPT